ncbi:hypothetical protein ACWC4C_43995 [Streptomyces olivaceoviridis]
MYESFLQLLRDSLPECLGSLMGAALLTGGGWSVKKVRDRMSSRRRVQADPNPIAEPADDTDHQQAA